MISRGRTFLILAAFVFVRIFFSDMHIIIVDLILKDNYVTEYSISKELKIGIDRTRLITNNLINEKLISFEERLFKKINSKDDIFKKNSKKDFKLRYLYFDKVLFGYNIKKKFKRLIFNCFKEKTKSLSSFLSCPRKICNKIYKKKDIDLLKIVCALRFHDGFSAFFFHTLCL